MPTTANTMFGGVASSPTAMMVNSPLLQGFGAGQAMQDQFTNTQLNQVAQDTANQQQQNVLQQSLLDNPNLAQQRQLQSGQMGVQQSLLDSGQQLASQGAQLDAKTQAALASTSDSNLEMLKNHGAAYIAAAQYKQQDPSAAMPGSSGNKAMMKILSDAGIKDVPAVAGPEEQQQIDARAASAPNTLDFIQKTQLQKQVAASTASIEQQKTASAEKIASGQQATEIARANIMAGAQKTMENVAARLIVQYNADPSSVNSNQIATVQDQLMRSLGPLQLNSISNQMNELVHMNDPPEKQAAARQKVLMDASSAYARMEAIRLKKIADEAKQESASPPPPTQGAAPQTQPADPNAGVDPTTVGKPKGSTRAFVNGQWGWNVPR